MIDFGLPINERQNLHWLPPGAVLRTYLSTQEPPREITPTVFSLAFKGDSLLMIEHSSRGWDIPGGHVESGETLIEALAREVREEGYVEVGDIVPLGCSVITVPAGVSNGKYPAPHSCMGFYVGRIIHETPFRAEHETLSRRFFAPEEARTLAWVQNNLALYEAALRVLRGDL